MSGPVHTAQAQDPLERLSPARAPFHILAKPIGPICNLDCEYCFYLRKVELFQDDHPGVDAYRMSEETLERFTRQYLACQHPDAPEVNFAWQGGEPTLLGVDFFRKAVEFQKKYAPEGVRITNSFQTNGVLLNDEWCSFFKEEGFLIGLSVDGPEELHDRFRKDKGGKGSFRRVMKGLEALKRHEVEFNTLTVVQSDNGSHPAKVYRFLKEIGSWFMQFIPIVEPEHGGSVSYRTVRPKQWGAFLNGIFDEWIRGDIGTIYVQHFELMMGLAMGYPASLCVHSPVCGRAVAIEHNGNLYSCDHFVYPANLLGSIYERTLSEMIDGEFQSGFGLDKERKLPGYCRRCNYLRYCYGGCPSDRCKRTPDGKPGLNWSCEGYKAFYAYTEPYFRAMAQAVQNRRPAKDYPLFMQNQGVSRKVGRNDPCPCGSGKKYKNCCLGIR